MDLNTPAKNPPSSPPFIPQAPTPPRILNAPPRGGISALASKTTEEIDAETEEERLAQQQDMEDAKAEEEESNDAMAALEGAFVPNGIFRHRGVGPLIYETKRGLIKVFSGDLVCHLNGPTNPEAPPEEWILEEEFIVVSEAVLTALLHTVEPRLFPESLDVRANRIGEERRAAAAEPPPETPVGDMILDQKLTQDQKSSTLQPSPNPTPNPPKAATGENALGNKPPDIPLSSSKDNPAPAAGTLPSSGTTSSTPKSEIKK